MAKQVTGSRANKPNDSFGVVNNPSLYKNSYREEVDKEDDDDDEVQAQDPTQEVATQEEQPTNPSSFVESQQKESIDFKKRYDDLKRHYDSKLQEWKDEKQDMVSRLSANQNSEAEVQKNDSSLDQFKNQYPDVYDAIDKISASKSDLKVKQLEQDLLSLKEKEVQLEKDKAYQEYSAVEEAVDQLDILTHQVTALNAAISMEVDHAEAILRVELGSKVNEMSSKELRRDLLLFARNNPSLFLSLANDENVQLRNFGIRATELGIIKLSSDQRSFTWGTNGRKLMNVPFDENPYSAFAAWLKTDEGVEVYRSIDKKL